MNHRLAVPAVVVCLLLIATTSAIAKPGKGGGGGGGGEGGGGGTGVVVSLGDSYISGEAGRWFGNSLNNDGSRDGTDRSYVKKRGGYYDVSRVYLQGTDSDGCHRADVADVHWVSGATTINLACSGAVTQNIFRASNGGTSQKGWAPQADQLAAVAAANDVSAIVLSIGGNDLGFSDIIISCTEDWFTSPSWWENHCHDDEQANVDNRMPAAMAGVAKAIDEIRAVMSTAGDSSYRLILRSYPSPIPRASENRYPESGWSRWDSGGCPFWNEDADWARDSLVPQISSNLRGVAASKGVEFLDLQNLLQGREVCAVTTSHVTSSPSGATHEWVRWLNTGYTQGDAQESLHPNAYGQQAAGACLNAVLATSPGNYACTNVAGAGPGTVALSTS